MSHPKVYAYSRNRNPAGAIKFNEIQSDGGTSEEETRCKKLENISNFYECTIDRNDVSDLRKKLKFSNEEKETMFLFLNRQTWIKKFTIT